MTELKPMTKAEAYWSAMADDSITPPEPQTTEECILAAMSGRYPVEKIKPQTREQGLMKKAVQSNAQSLKFIEESSSEEFTWADIKGSLTVPDGVTSIGDSAFENCKYIESVSLPDSIVTIGDYAFKGCTALEEVILEEGVTSIGKEIFKDCTNLKKVGFPTTLRTMGEAGYSTFDNCDSLEEIVFSGGTITIGDALLFNCTNLESIIFNATIDDGLSYYGFTANSPKLSLMRFDGGFTETGYISDSAFTNLGNEVPLTIVINAPEHYYKGEPWGAKNVEVIWTGGEAITDFSYMYANQHGITSVRGLEHRNTGIGTNFRGMFSGCYDLTSAKVDLNNAENEYSLGNIVYGCQKLQSLYLYNIRHSIKIGGVMKYSTGEIDDEGYDIKDTLNYGALLTDASLKHIARELCDGDDVRTLSLYWVCYNRLKEFYFKITDSTSEKLTATVHDSQVEGAITAEEYLAMKHWTLESIDGKKADPQDDDWLDYRGIEHD